MKILILGFTDYCELDRTMNKLIEDSQCFLFTVLCGGAVYVPNSPSVAETWAKNNGAPIEYIFNEDTNKLTKQLVETADYLVLKRTDNMPFMIKKIFMTYKGTGKHGTVV